MPQPGLPSRVHLARHVGSGNIALLGFLRALAGPNKPYRPPEFAWSMAECIRLRKVNVLGGGAQHGNGDQ